MQPTVKPDLRFDLHDALGIRKRQRPKQRRVGDAEEGRGDAHRQRDRQDDDRREAGLAGDHPAGVANVLHHRFHDASSANAVSAVLHDRQIAETLRRRAFRGARGETTISQLLFPHLEMEPHLFADLVRDSVAPERRARYRDQVSKDPHGVNR